MDRKDIKILVVDDTEAMRIRLKDLLMKIGFTQVFVADGVEAAISLVLEHRVHLVLCDWNMAPVDGKEFLTQLRALPATRTLPFMMVTAECAMDKVLEAINGGVDDYLVKPFTEEQLEAKVQTVLRRKQIL